jgi:hypothetical protein
MTDDEVRAAAERLARFHERFAPLFGKEQARDHAYTHVAETFRSRSSRCLPTNWSPPRRTARSVWSG